MEQVFVVLKRTLWSRRGGSIEHCCEGVVRSEWRVRMAARQKRRGTPEQAECQRLLMRYIEKHLSEAKRLWSELQSKGVDESDVEESCSMIAASRTSLDIVSLDVLVPIIESFFGTVSKSLLLKLSMPDGYVKKYKENPAGALLIAFACQVP
eukprot:5504409-Amphidinium_carterae.1